MKLLRAVDDDRVAVRGKARRMPVASEPGLGLGDGERAEAARGDARQQAALLLARSRKSMSGFIAWKVVAQMMPVEAQAMLISRTAAR